MSAMMTVIMIVPAVILLLLLLLLRTVVGGWRYRGYQQLPVADPDVAVEDGGEDEESARDTRLVIPAPYEATYTIASPAAAATMAAAVQRDAVTSTPISITREVSGYSTGSGDSESHCPNCERLADEKKDEIERLRMRLQIERTKWSTAIEMEKHNLLDELEEILLYVAGNSN